MGMVTILVMLAVSEKIFENGGRTTTDASSKGILIAHLVSLKAQVSLLRDGTNVYSQPMV